MILSPSLPKKIFSGVRAEVWLILILLLALAFRWLGPFLQQSTGDSLHYVALAMKLRTSGLHGYNLRGVALQKSSLNHGSVDHVLQITPSPAEDPEGDLIRDLRREYLSYYDEPLHHIAYGYPALLVLIHTMSGHTEQEGWQLVHYAIEPWDLVRLHPLVLAYVQWYWLMPALLSSLGTVVLTFFLGKFWFGRAGGLWAAFLMAIHPLDILTAQRVWADDTLVFICLAALICWNQAKKWVSWKWALFGGILLGCAILVKQSAIFFAVGVVVAESVSPWLVRRYSQKSEALARTRLAVVCMMGVLLITIHWFVTVWSVYGIPFYNPPVEAMIEKNPWQGVLLSRPSPIIFYSVGLFCLSPCMFLGWFGIRQSRVLWLLIMALVYVGFFVVLGQHEYRYVVPILPILAISAGHVLTQISGRWKVAMMSLILAQVVWSLYLTDQYAWRNYGEIMTPF